ncbi:hypothetical protein ACNHYB_02495 [Isoptericola jiangsuensis]|uniref:hypothetical protein n=1 Tax=Isoptericola jiangsuensis TaxID=548579 RepID=UPI003AAF9A58
MIVITADQRSSTTRGDLVPAVLDRVGARVTGSEVGAGLVLAFDRTVGDEVQGVLDASDEGATLAVEVLAELLRDGGWAVGVGVGAVDQPLATSSRAASGRAFVRARAAVEEAKRRGSAVPLAVRGGDQEPSATIVADAQALLRLVGVVVARRSAPGWEAVDTLALHEGDDAPQRATARALGVSEQAVSQRLRSASWSEELAARPLAARLLRAADAATTADDEHDRQDGEDAPEVPGAHDEESGDA